jgi:hypothetical protein
MEKSLFKFHHNFLIFARTLTSLSAAAQTIPNPLLVLQDSASDGAFLPLLQLQGGAVSSTQGIEVTSQSTLTSSPPNLSSVMGTGFGGLLLVQNSPAVSGAGENSPLFCISGNQWNGAASASVAAVWCLNVKGGGAAGTTDSPDVIEWTRPTGTGYGNPTGDLTMLWPGAVNLASDGQITVGPNVDTSLGNVSGIPSTFTGQKTQVNSGTVAAGPVTLEPGQLTASSVPAGATEGPLQILQSYIAGSGASTAVGTLACPVAAQTVIPCLTTGAAENWVGVFNSIPGSQGVSVTPLRYGRVPIKTAGSTAVTFNAGDFVCKDDANASYVVTNSTTPCPVGESIGIAVGDPSSGTSHVVDLVPEASVSGAAAQGQILQFTCIGAVPTVASTIYLNGGQCSVGSGTDAVEFTLPYPSGTYRFSQMYVNYGHVGLTGDTVTLFVNGSSGTTPVSCAPTTTGQCSDLTHTLTITGGQTYSIRVSTGASDSLKNINVTIRLQ